eukprot:TRINITY_DN1174_c0_g1_i1.p1 TRINITY_DN1174_c0_g1~~TRINITY_DN1174_c0_g1_i1.p1  ORF type:complete len:412 (-),score=80.35 TRINITY_DN1174_c0_g1_i1:221-1300(-)
MVMLKFEGAQYLRQRIVLATLSRKSVLIRNIRSMSDHPGLKEYETSFLRLIEKVTNGTRLEIDETGTSLYYKPGLIVNGKVKHECSTERGIGYYLEGLLPLAPFGKDPLYVTLSGITNHNDKLDISVDAFRTVVVPTLTKFGLAEGVEFKVLKRGAPPLGGGEILFRCPAVKQLSSLDLVDPGKIRRVRGIVYTTRMTPNIANRIVDVTKGILTPYVKDVFIYTDHYKGPESGLSPGYGVTLVAETTTGCHLSSESMAEKQTLPEDIATNCANQLLHEVLLGGCTDSALQSMIITLLAMGPEDICHFRLGQLTEYSISLLRHLKIFFGVVYNLVPDTETNTVLLSGFGTGYFNMSKGTA